MASINATPQVLGCPVKAVDAYEDVFDPEDIRGSLGRMTPEVAVKVARMHLAGQLAEDCLKQNDIAEVFDGLLNAVNNQQQVTRELSESSEDIVRKVMDAMRTATHVRLTDVAPEFDGLTPTVKNLIVKRLRRETGLSVVWKAGRHVVRWYTPKVPRSVLSPKVSA
jgi:flagellar hook-basal body complex protein FliE